MTASPALPGLTVVLTSSVVFAVLCPPAWQPWVQFAVAALVACVISVRHRGRPLLTRAPRRRRTAVDVVDLVAPDLSLVGCVEGDHVLTTAVEITAGALTYTDVGRDDPADFHGTRLPLGVVARQLDQGGVLLEGVDVVVHGRRATSGPDGEVYGSLVGPLALISHRRVHLLLRFDLAQLTRTPGVGSDTSFQQLVAVATERLRRALVHHGVPSRVLDATALAALYLEAETEPPDGVGLLVRPVSNPRQVVDALTAVRASTVTEVLRLRSVRGRGDVVDMVTSIGLTGTTAESLHASAGACHPLPSGRVLPVPGEALPGALAGSLVRCRIERLDLLSPPAHGAGQILGATRTGCASALQLAGPHLRSVLLAGRPPLCRQVVFRAVAAGYRVAVVTDVPVRWRPLLAIADDSRYRIVAPGASDAGAPVDAVVWDVDGALSEGRIDAFAGPGGPDVLPPTVIRIETDWEAGGAHRTDAAARPDLILDGRVEGWLSVEPRDGDAHRVAVVAGPGEEKYLGAPRGDGAAQPA
ncbi:type VII secretion protein EccE [Dietzia sp. PP-33]|uniref:type VII secretion protein EccE n=1 Tax=Dietzia sp. PP-33 TaxID=2957500 RepID=UPI0029BC3E27|nr:hypothetical protein [Dietzia sp. PP-33]MDX2358096.1 hypothetical protein [Dietzia sp. PP-33]